MGKNKKMNNVFKVAGAKSLKLKAKAKVVKSNLKNITTKNKEKISELDKQFVEMREKNIQQHTEKKDDKKPNTSKLPNTRENEAKVQRESQNTMDSLSEMKL